MQLGNNVLSLCGPLLIARIHSLPTLKRQLLLILIPAGPPEHPDGVGRPTLNHLIIGTEPLHTHQTGVLPTLLFLDLDHGLDEFEFVGHLEGLLVGLGEALVGG